MKSEPRRPARWPGLLGIALLLLGLAEAPARADVTLEGSPEEVFALQPTDCPDCSAWELQVLEEGFELARRQLRRRVLNPAGEVCTGEASLIRELALTTFPLWRDGVISRNRWEDFVKARTRLSAGLSPQTLESLLDAYVQRVFEQIDVTHESYPLVEASLRTYGAVQLAKVFHDLGAGFWEPEIHWVAIGTPTITEGDVVLALTTYQGVWRPIWDQELMDLPLVELWSNAQANHLATLPDDFQTPTVVAERDQLLADYLAEVEADPVAALADGCGFEASAGLLAAAQVEAVGLIVIDHYNPSTSGSYTKEGGDPLDDHQGDTDLPASFDDEITVTAGGLPLPPGGAIAPPGGDPSGPTQGGGGGGGGDTPGGPGTEVPHPDDPERTGCDPKEELCFVENCLLRFGGNAASCHMLWNSCRGLVDGICGGAAYASARLHPRLPELVGPVCVALAPECGPDSGYLFENKPGFTFP